jgi:RNA polymerase sigma-70 factor (ECF subfamily)
MSMSSQELEPISELFTAHGRELVSRARRLIRSQTDAEDAVQDAMLALLEAPHLLGTVESLGGWIYTLVKRRCVDLIRRESSQRDRASDLALEPLFPEASAAHLAEQSEFWDATADAIEALPETLRTVVISNGIHGQSFRELSEQMQLPMGTLMARKKKGIDRVRQTLRRQGFFD